MYNIIKNLTIEDLVKIIISQHNDLYEIDEKEIDEEVYTINELLEKYKIFTRYNLNKAIYEKKLPYFNIGNKKYFKKSEIDNWLNNQSDNNK